MQNLETEIRTEEKNFKENRENADLISYFDISEIDKENIESNTLINIIKEENEYFDKRSNKQKLLLQLENDNFILQGEFDNMKSHLKYLEVTKATVVKEMTVKTNYLRSLEEREKESIKKKMKSIENSDKMRQNLNLNMEQKSLMIGKIEEVEKKRKEEIDKFNDISKNVIFCCYLFLFFKKNFFC